MLIFYSESITNRLKYIVEFIFKDILQIKYELTDDIDRFRQHSGPKINYSKQPIDDSLFFYATPLLFEKGVKQQEFSVFDYRHGRVFFSTNNASALPFDPFAAAFYLVSRYEEYLPALKDKFGRYQASRSLAGRNGFLYEPVIDQWALEIREYLLANYPGLVFGKRKYKFTPTYDIDSAYAYLNKGLVRIIGGYLKALSDFNLENMAARTKVYLGLSPDPYHTFDWLHHIQQKYQLNPIYFFLVGDYDEYDKNVSIRNFQFQTLIKSVADHARVGIHPSYASNQHPAKLKTEIKRLSAVLKTDIQDSRQHFLKIDLPTTYQELIENDIKNDYTMGYASDVGFRAGTCTPFYFYNLDMEVKTPLMVHPFAFMEATLQYYLQLSPEKAVEWVKPLIDAVKKVDGHLYMVCHNNSFCEAEEWIGWREAYESMIQLSVP